MFKKSILNNQWIKEIRKEITKHSELTDDENRASHWGDAAGTARGQRLPALDATLEYKGVSPPLRDLSFHPRNWKKSKLNAK